MEAREKYKYSVRRACKLLNASRSICYYQSVKDTGLELFAESIPRGISEINYEMVVAMSGQFTSGPARLQCMYQPSVTAYSGAQVIVAN